MSHLHLTIKRILLAVRKNEPTIVVFVGELSLTEEIATSITQNLPETFISNIDIKHISDSTFYLKGHRFCTSIFHDSCFSHVTPEQFLLTHWQWQYKLVHKLYDKQPGLQEHFSVDDAFQESYFYLERILSKYNGQCNLRTFVANRMRKYFSQIIEKKLKERVREIEYMLDRQNMTVTEFKSRRSK